MEYCCRI